ncbi:hypothetical protein ABW21_db0207183 [Orbilia brochopaga]|nr:hypothetical protein ABW21_db0207183 [Drechslerella brochopaga]
MPEGITAYDMRRMLAARFKDTTVRIEYHRRWFKLSKSSTRTDCDDCEPTGATMTTKSLEVIEPLMNTEFNWSADDIRFHGKQLGILLPGSIWLKIKFALHGHCTIITKQHYDIIKEKVIERPESPIEFYWIDDKLGPCPIQEPTAFEENILAQKHLFLSIKRCIFKELTMAARNEFWNGIGTSHANDILFFARIHPAETVTSVFSGDALDRLLKAVRFFFQQCQTQVYLKRVPSTSTAVGAFEVSDGPTKWYNTSFIKVYRKQTCLVSEDYYQCLKSENGLSDEVSGPRRHRVEASAALDSGPRVLRSAGASNVSIIENKIARRRRLPVYRVRWPKDGSGRRYAYAYTVIETFPADYDTSVTADHRAWKPLNWRNKSGEIGVTNFLNYIRARTDRESNKGRIRTLINEDSATGKSTRKRGRPPKGRKGANEPKADPNRKRLKQKAEKERMRAFNELRRLEKQENKLRLEQQEEEAVEEETGAEEQAGLLIEASLDQEAKSLQALTLRDYDDNEQEIEEGEQELDIWGWLDMLAASNSSEQDAQGAEDENEDEEDICFTVDDVD